MVVTDPFGGGGGPGCAADDASLWTEPRGLTYVEFQGGSGKDVLIGPGGSIRSTLIGGGGSDYIQMSANEDNNGSYAYGGSYTINDKNEVVLGDAAHDGDDTLVGRAHAPGDSRVSDSPTEKLFGGEGNDCLVDQHNGLWPDDRTGGASIFSCGGGTDTYVQPSLNGSAPDSCERPVNECPRLEDWYE